VIYFVKFTRQGDRFLFKAAIYISLVKDIIGKVGLTQEFIQRYDLTRRQADVTEIVLLGKPDREIAALLDIGLNTVKTHLKKVYKKTGVRGRCALMVLVGRGGK
jgi:DNA-binding CsgD family transcriptional regulator